MEYPTFKLSAVVKQELPQNTPVFNSGDFEYYLWVQVPKIIARDFSLYEIHEQCEPYKCINLSYFCYHESGRKWYRLLSDKLNKEVGLHVYRMLFVNRYTNDVMSLYFAYVLQNDDPKKPYVYMERDGKCGCCANVKF